MKKNNRKNYKFKSQTTRMKYMRISFAIVVLSFIIAFIAYPFMPEQMASHWNIHGEADGFSGKLFALFLIPVLSLGLTLLLKFLPVIDPYRKNYKKFSKYYSGIILTLTIFLLYLLVLSIVANLGISFNFILLLVPALSTLLFYAGILVQKAKRNWFAGIRTPWTLSSESVWNKTHHVGGRLIKISAIISLLGIFFPKLAIWFILLPISLSAIFSVVYSYILFKKSKKRK